MCARFLKFIVLSHIALTSSPNFPGTASVGNDGTKADFTRLITHGINTNARETGDVGEALLSVSPNLRYRRLMTLFKGALAEKAFTGGLRGAFRSIDRNAANSDHSYV